MKIGILFEGNNTIGGGFYFQLKSSLIINEIGKYKTKIEFIVLNKKSDIFLRKKGLKTNLFKNNLFSKYFSKLYAIDYIKDLLQKININHPFTSFLKKEKYDLIIFFSPSEFAKFCGRTGFIINIWDLDHKKNSQFPEHNTDFVFEKREKLLKEIVFRAFKIIVPDEQIKQDLVKFYFCSDKSIIVQTFIPVPPTIYKEGSKKGLNYKKIFQDLNLPKDKKIIFYPAAYWPHKNHKYIIDTAKILLDRNILNFYFVFSGTDKGNYEYIKKSVNLKKLNEFVKVLPLISDDELVSLYVNTDAVVMPTYGGPSNFPIYESFFFKKPLFYTKNLLNDKEILENLIEIDTLDPEDFFKKLEILLDKQHINRIVENAYDYFNKVCDEEIFKKNYKNMLDEFEYLIQRWKEK